MTGALPTPLQLAHLVQLGRRTAAQLIETGRNRLPSLHARHVTSQREGANPFSDPQWRVLAVLALDQQGARPQFAFASQRAKPANAKPAPPTNPIRLTTARATDSQTKRSPRLRYLSSVFACSGFSGSNPMAFREALA